MNSTFKLLKKLDDTQKLKISVFAAIILFGYKIVFPASLNIFVMLAGELLVLVTFILWSNYLIVLIKNRINATLTILLNVAILNTVILFILKLAYKLFDYSFVKPENINFLESIFNGFLAFIVIVSAAYIFEVIETLFYLKQKKEPKLYFNLMIIMMIVTSLTRSITYLGFSAQFLIDAFEAITISLIVMNSFRVAWIAFLSKSEKIKLLALSIILIVLFGTNTGVTWLNESFPLYNFSPGFTKFLSLLMIYGIIYFSVVLFTTLFHIPTAGAIDRKTQELSSLMDLNKLLNRITDLKELGETVTKMTGKVCECEAAWLSTFENEELHVNSVNNIGFVEAQEYTEYLRKIKTSEAGIVTYQNDELENSGIKIKDKFNSILAAPLNIHGKVIGYLFAARKNEYNFDLDDENSIAAFAGYAAVAYENAKLVKESIEKEKLEKELDLARQIQHKILPKKIPRFNNLDIAASFIPAFRVGGDYYDFFELGNNKLGFVIADVSGKGIEAAFIMAEVKGIFESLSKVIDNPKELFIRANEILSKTLDKQKFVTATYGILDVLNGKFVFSRAGHSPLLHYHNGEVKKYIPKGIGLGIDTGNKFSSFLTQMEIKLNNDDIIVLFTDGVNESQNEKFEDFGYERLEKIISKYNKEDANTLSEKIIYEITVFSKNNIQHDDITLVILKWNFNNKSFGEN